MDNPRDEREVMDALEKVAVKLGREMPTIELNGYREPFTGFHLRDDNVKLHTEKGTVVSYNDFIIALDTYFNAK